VISLLQGGDLNLAVVSDTHRNLSMFRRAVGSIISRRPIDLFIHLGDDYEDAEVLDEFELDYVRVPGVFSDYYTDTSVPNRRIEEYEGWRFLLTHTPESHPNDLQKDIKPEDAISQKQVDVMLYGHLHTPEILRKDGVLFVNPGHLKEVDKKGFEPSYALLRVRGEEIAAEIIGAREGNCILSRMFKREGT
jgi:hypothetical protein